jgi:hypothetical protein
MNLITFSQSSQIDIHDVCDAIQYARFEARGIKR